MADDEERGTRRTGVLLGVLGTLVVVLAVALAVVLASDDDDDGGGADRPGTVATATTQPPATVTETEPPPTTATTPALPTVTSGQAKSAAARGAATEAQRGGITIPPADWDVRCTASGGGVTAERWLCQVASSSGQCTGTILVVATEPNVPATREPRIGCGE